MGCFASPVGYVTVALKLAMTDTVERRMHGRSFVRNDGTASGPIDRPLEPRP